MGVSFDGPSCVGVENGGDGLVGSLGSEEDDRGGIRQT